ncbi:MAG: tRNA dihydrouridine synthase [Myxococcota bacterium]
MELALSHPTFLAPMEGVTHPTFRALTVERGGVGMVCTEFVRIARGPLSPKNIAREVVRAPGVPLSVQVMGNEAERMAEAAGVVAETGADVVDINLGCPAPRAVRKGVGAAMLRDQALLFAVVRAMRQAVDRASGGRTLLSAKMRAGFDDGARVVETARVLESAGVDFLAVHPRRRCDFYEGVADWRIVTELVRDLDIPVVGNGDVWYAADALRMQRETGCTAVMIGRPALRNPWIFAQIEALSAGREPHGPSGDDVLAYLDDVRSRYERAFARQPHVALGKLKEMLRYLGRAVPDEREFLRHVLRQSDVPSIMRTCEEAFQARPAHALDLDAAGAYGLEPRPVASVADLV